jgi:purine-binding chemotaxis protein CheW
MIAVETTESTAPPKSRQAGGPTPTTQSTPSTPAAPELRECLTFRLGAEEYGIDILRVQEIRGYEAPTRIANAPAFIKGVVNLRGVIVRIVDLRMKFGLVRVDYDTMTVTVVLNVAGRTVGVVVDSVSDVIELKGDQIKPAPEFNSVVDSGYVVGIGAIKQGEQERMLILVDIERLMTSAEMGLVNTQLH